MAMNNSLAEVHPELVSEWSEKNLPLTPDDITFGSNKAQYSLDCENGIENAVLLKPQTPEMVVEENSFRSRSMPL